MKITLVKGIGFIINLVWTGGGQGAAEGMDPCLSLPAWKLCRALPQPRGACKGPGHRREGRRASGKVASKLPSGVTQWPPDLKNRSPFPFCPGLVQVGTLSRSIIHSLTHGERGRHWRLALKYNAHLWPLIPGGLHLRG